MTQTVLLSHERIPVTIITGFLGSGKTTLLNHILTQQEGLKTAVLVNEFGEIGIDNDLIISTEDNIIELNNGCICCTINEDLVTAIDKILERQKQIDYLIVETTGIADPFPVALTFLGTNLKDKTRLDSIITLADCENFSLDKFENSEAAFSQFAHADVVLLNKTDLVDSGKIDDIEQKINEIKEDVRILKTTNAKVSLPLILSVGLFESDLYFQPNKEEHKHHKLDRHDHKHDHSHHLDNDGFVSVSFTSDKPLSIRKFQYFLDNQLPIEVFRAKGFLWFKDSEFKHIFHLSGKRFSIIDEHWKKQPKTELVFIGQHLKIDELKLLLENCVM
ncbi:CobW family GTP-binding protein [Geminocystis sp. CENA526]|uniref:CobW family GTP-binding protein n=1 Tax=Geminocystis sp. CENA526 TaxID=1355871 RepID=UPI003D6FC8A3